MAEYPFTGVSVGNSEEKSHKLSKRFLPFFVVGVVLTWAVGGTGEVGEKNPNGLSFIMVGS